MQRVSNEYKEIMKRKIRNRGYISVGIGIVNNEAQRNAKLNGTFAYWSNNKSALDNVVFDNDYATLEENFFKLDGNMCFIPKDNELAQFKDKGLVTENILGSVTVDFSNVYDIKGLTIDFGNAYPTNFTVETDKGTKDYTNNSNKFVTTDVLGEIKYIKIIPNTMVGGQQRMRIKSILMGVGLNYGNKEIKASNLKEFVSAISEDLPTIDFSLSIFDYDNLYDVDNNNSFVNYLDVMQKITVSYGLELDNGDIEWVKCGTLFLKEWQSKVGEMSFTATDRLYHLNDTYILGNKIYTRTAYEEAISILTDSGLQPDEYDVDVSLKDVTLTNPIPEMSHKEALQIVANVCRCVVKQDVDGKIVIKPNFANIIEPTDIAISSNSEAEWSKIENILVGSSYVYADMTKNFFKLDETQYLMPQNNNFTLETGYVSKEISDMRGDFKENPKIYLSIPAPHSYYAIYCDFDGTPPKEVTVYTYANEVLKEIVIFSNIEQNNVFNHDFIEFDTLVFEFTKTSPNSRILVNKISFGNMSEYSLGKDDMLKHPQGYKEEVVSNVKVKIFSFQNDEKGKPQVVEDNVFYNKNLNLKGNTVEWKNPLVSTVEQATNIAEWLGNHYKNNISYDVEYRGEPRISASDIIYMDSNVLNNLQVEVETRELSFNGAFKGKLELRRALNMMTQGE